MSNDVIEVIEASSLVEVLTGLPGAQGENTLPDGGTVGQVLTKASSADQDVEWQSITQIHVGTMPPTNPQVGDLWVDTN